MQDSGWAPEDCTGGGERPTAWILQHMWFGGRRGPAPALPSWEVRETLRPSKDGRSCDGGHQARPGLGIPEAHWALKDPKDELSCYRRETEAQSSPWPGISCPFEGEWLDAVEHLVRIAFN